MVEQDEGPISINDTGDLSKETKETYDWGEVQDEITDYWDISGGGSEMDLTSTSTGRDKQETMKLEACDPSNTTCVLDNVSSSTAEGNAMVRKTTYCDNGQCAMKKELVGLDENDNIHYNHNNSNISDIPACTDGDDISKNDASCKHPNFVNHNTNSNNTNCNSIGLQKEHNTVGIAGDNSEKLKNDVSDTLSDNIETSGAKDNCVDGESKVALSIRETMLLDSDCTEERFRIDRKKLEQMLQAATEGRGQSGEDFFQKIMDETNTFITWPSKIKLGAKSRKDPHIRICGTPSNIKDARQRVMACLDTKSNRVTIKMDVSHTEHSHVIGKGGNNIKRVMQETGCHIHFPDSNRNTAGEKSNQVSITGHPEGVENARQKIRTLLPVVLQFEIPNNGLPIPDLNSPMIQHLVQVYGISIQFKQRAKVYSTSCTVRGSADNTDGLKTGIQSLMNHITRTQLPATTQIEIAPQHHNYMLTKPGVNVTSITQATGARVIFPDPSALPKKSTVYISGNVDSVILARHKLMGCLPLLLMFDTKDESPVGTNDSLGIAQLMETLDISINIKSKPKQPSKTVIIKSIESNIYNMFEARGKLLGLESSGVPRPSQSLSPKLSRNTTVTPTPVILLPQPHIANSTVQAAVIGLPEQKPATPIVLTGPSYVLTRNMPSNGPQSRPVSSLSTSQTPSQSPFPALQNGTLNQPTIERKTDELSRNPYDITNHIASPLLVTQGNNAIIPNQYQTVNVTSAADMQRHIDQKISLMANQSLPISASNRQGQIDTNYLNPTGYHNGRVILSPPFEPNAVRGLDQDDVFAQQDIGMREKMLNEQLLRNGGGFGNPQGIITDGDYLRRQFGITEHHATNSIDSTSLSQINSVSPNSRRLSYSQQSIRSPDSIAESRTSIPSDRNSPTLPSSRNSNSRLTGYDQFEDPVGNQASPGNTASSFQSLANRDSNNLSPMSNQHRSPQIVLNQESQGAFDSNGIPDSDLSSGPPPGFEGFAPQGHAPDVKLPDYDDLYKRAKKAMENKPIPSEVRTPTDIWAGYGFSKSMPFEMKEKLKKLASSRGRLGTNLPTTYENGETERNQPSPVEEESEYGTENRIPNQLRVPLPTPKGGSNLSAWRKRRMANMNLSVGGNMGLNYSVQRPTPQKNSAFTRVNPNESINRSNHSPSNHANETIPQPQRQVINSPFSNSGNDSTLRVPLSENSRGFDPRINMNSTPTIQDSLGLNTKSNSNSTKVEPDISDVLTRLGLSKYIQVFQQQEVDYQTFLTLTESDLKELGITTFGPRKKILIAIKDLNGDRDVFAGSALQESAVHENISDQMLQVSSKLCL